MIEVTRTLSVCHDCLCWIANGDDSALDMLDERFATKFRTLRDETIDAFLAEHEGNHLVAGSEEYGFSHDRCDLCSCLGGNRFEASILTPKKEKE